MGLDYDQQTKDSVASFSTERCGLMLEHLAGYCWVYGASFLLAHVYRQCLWCIGVFLACAKSVCLMACLGPPLCVS